MNRKLLTKITNKFSAPDFLQFLREFGCAISNGDCFGVCDPHHVTYLSHEGSDLDAIPLCRFHHDQFHKIGEEGFCDLYEIPDGFIQRMLIHLYLIDLQRGGRPEITGEKRKLARGKNLQKPTKPTGSYVNGVFTHSVIPNQHPT